MATFAYSGVQAGKRVNGEINASDTKAASLALRQKKIIVTGIKKAADKKRKLIKSKIFQSVMRPLYLKAETFI